MTEGHPNPDPTLVTHERLVNGYKTGIAIEPSSRKTLETIEDAFATGDIFAVIADGASTAENPRWASEAVCAAWKEQFSKPADQTPTAIQQAIEEATHPAYEEIGPLSVILKNKDLLAQTTCTGIVFIDKKTIRVLQSGDSAAFIQKKIDKQTTISRLTYDHNIPYSAFSAYPAIYQRVQDILDRATKNESFNYNDPRVKELYAYLSLLQDTQPHGFSNAVLTYNSLVRLALYEDMLKDEATQMLWRATDEESETFEKYIEKKLDEIHPLDYPLDVGEFLQTCWFYNNKICQSNITVKEHTITDQTKKLVLMSDGITDVLTPERINDILNRGLSPAQTAKAIIEAVHQVSPEDFRYKDDDKVVIVIDVSEEPITPVG